MIRVSRALLGIAAGAVLLGAASPASANDADRQTLKTRLSFRYVDQPTNAATSYSPQVLDNAAIVSGTESGPFWANTNMRKCQQLVRGLLRDARNGGDDNIQFYAAKIVQILDKPVIVYLLDDTGGPINATSQSRWGACPDNANKAWPCASNMSTSDDWLQDCYRTLGQTPPARRDGTWAGQMALGAAVLNANTKAWALGTFIHELVHTQDRSDDRGHLFWVNTVLHRYGQDDVHYTHEAVPNLAMTYMEGIANTITLLVDSREATNNFNWFAQNGALGVEKTSAPEAGAVARSTHQCHLAVAVSPDVWLYNQLKRAGVPEVSGTLYGPGYAYFRLRDLRPRFIVHNEFILAMIFSEYARHLGVNKFVNAIKSSNQRLYRVSGSGIATLFDTLCHAGLEGRSLDAVTGVSEAGAKPYLIPLAYADYFTGYRARTKAEYAAIYENLLNPRWVDLYWDGYKDHVRGTVPFPATPQFGDLTSIAIALGVNQSRPD